MTLVMSMIKLYMKFDLDERGHLVKFFFSSKGSAAEALQSEREQLLVDIREDFYNEANQLAEQQDEDRSSSSDSDQPLTVFQNNKKLTFHQAEENESDMLSKMIQRLIRRPAKKVIFDFKVKRHGNQYSGRLLKYKSQTLLVVWLTSDIRDADLCVLDGEMKKFQKTLQKMEVDSCCCDDCCEGCSRCILGTLCCFYCVSYKKRKKGDCGVCKEACVKRASKVFEDNQDSGEDDDEKRVLEEQADARRELNR